MLNKNHHWRSRAIMIAAALITSACVTSNTAKEETTNSKTTAAWQTEATQGHVVARHEAGLVNVDNKIYLLGGRRINPTNVYDPKTKQWQTLAKPPIEIHHFQPVAFQGKIYVIGAMTGGYPYEKPLESILVFDPKTNTWSTGDTIPKERRRGGAGVSIYQDKIYISGGITNGHYDGTVTWFDEYNPLTGEWKTLSDMPDGRDHFQSAVVDNKLYAAGGRISSAKTKQVFALVVNEVNVFDFTTQTWSTLKNNLPTGRAGNTTVAVKNQIWVIGGESGSQKVAHNDVEIFDVASQTWLSGQPLKRGRHGSGAVIVENTLWTASGSGNRGGGPELTSVEKLKLN